MRGFPSGQEYRFSKGPSGLDPHWSPDGSELFFLEGSNGQVQKLTMSVFRIDTSGDTPEITDHQVLFPMRQPNAEGTFESYGFGVNWGSGYDILPDGSFLMSRGVDVSQQQEIILVQNWLTELRQMAPPDPGL